MLRRFVPALLVLLSAPQVAARGGMPSPLTERGILIEDLYYTLFLLATGVFLLVMALLVIIMVKFRANGGSGRQTFEIERDNLKMEMAWIGIPLIVVLWVGVISYAGLVTLDEGIQEEDSWMTLDVTGYQWTWLADYGSGIAMFSDPSPVDGSVAEDKTFIVPADQPIRFNITGGDVIHAFHLMDKNWATVGLVDANPYGPHKYNTFSAILPEGTYTVQCREMCFNPGHGYMRATVKAVPMAEFESWMEDKGIVADADLPQAVTVDHMPGAMSEGYSFVTGDGSRAVVTFTNNEAQSVAVAAPGFELLQAEFAYNDGPTVDIMTSNSIDVPAGATVKFAFDIAEAGDFHMRAGSEVYPFTVIEAQAVSVILDDFFIVPGNIELMAGETYLFQVTNVGATSHNIFIGTKTADAQDEQWMSATIDGGGATTSFLVTPTETTTLDAWCNVPGHWPEMAGTVTIS